MTYLPRMEFTEDGLSASLDITPMVHDLARQVVKRVEEGAVGEVIDFLAVKGHLADVIRKAKAEALREAAAECLEGYEVTDNRGVYLWLERRAKELEEL